MSKKEELKKKLDTKERIMIQSCGCLTGKMQQDLVTEMTELRQQIKELD